MDYEEFKNQLAQSVKAAAVSQGEGTHAAFLQLVTDEYMVPADHLPESIVPAYYCGVGTHKRSLQIDGYYEDVADNSFALFFADYEENPKTYGKATIESSFKKLKYFAEDAINTDMYLDIEPSIPASDAIDRLRELAGRGEINKYKLYVITNAEKSRLLKKLPLLEINGVPAECFLWDSKRIYETAEAGGVKEPIEIDFMEYVQQGISSLEACAASNSKYKSYLCVIPGQVLADIYDKYGSRLLEGNVRSFLSVKRKVNKKIRYTILNEPERFFAYNNGIAATARDLKFINDKEGLKLVKASDFQIINGGQTTASLSSARYKDKADLAGIYVQMKITLIAQMEQDDADALIHDISRSSNSQNAVSEADFFATAPFHVEMEKISRRVLAPAVDGAQYETYWFYERARGQYAQMQMRMTKAQKNNFKLSYPKEQLITKTDLAKFRYSWEEHPQYVSQGAQTNFMKFASEITNQWEKDKDVFNELWFKESVAMGIMFKTIEKIVSNASWYQKAYRANIVTYTMAMLHYLIEKQYPKSEFNFQRIWNEQKLPYMMYDFINVLAKKVADFITDENDDMRTTSNVTQWCKRDGCWKNMKEKISMTVPADYINIIQSHSQAKAEKHQATRLQHFDNNIYALNKVLELRNKWLIIARDARAMGLITNAKQAQAIKTAERWSARQSSNMPQDFQAPMLIEILEKLKENGKKY